MGNAGPAALSIKGLRRVYRDGFTAVSDLDIELADGAFFGVARHRTRAARRLIGLTEQEVDGDRFLSIRQPLIYHAATTASEARPRCGAPMNYCNSFVSTTRPTTQPRSCPVACNADLCSPAR
jgi:hypothetical protein